MQLKPLILTFVSMVLAHSVAAQYVGGQIKNSDEIVIYFPAFEGENELGRNVSAVLALQFAQTMRRAPWPENPLGHDFGTGTIRYSSMGLEETTAASALQMAMRADLLAQLVVWGTAQHFGNAMIADIRVSVPHYAPPGCMIPMPCDFRTHNFEVWALDTQAGRLFVDLPRRDFEMTAVPMNSDFVREYEEAAGLPIRSESDGGPVIGFTGDRLRFIEFNHDLPGAPALVESGGIIGYVSLPELGRGGRVSEFAHFTGGLVKLLRGDYEGSADSFGSVIDNPSVRMPLLVDTLLLRAAALERLGKDGIESSRAALELAPYDREAVRFHIMALLDGGSEAQRSEARALLVQKRRLFPPKDPWVKIALGALDIDR